MRACKHVLNVIRLDPCAREFKLRRLGARSREQVETSNGQVSGAQSHMRRIANFGPAEIKPSDIGCSGPIAGAWRRTRCRRKNMGQGNQQGWLILV